MYHNNKNNIVSGIHIIKNHAIFSRTEQNIISPKSILQKIIYNQHPYAFIKQKRACIKFKHASTTIKTICQSCNSIFYSQLSEIKNIIDDAIFSAAKYNHIITHLLPNHIYYFDHKPILISYKPITQFNSLSFDKTDIIHISRTHLANLLTNIILILPQKPDIPPMSPIGSFISQYATIK